MKKQIISIALIVAMVVAMVPTMLMPASAAQAAGYIDGYDVYVSETAPTFDGQLDDVYKNSEKIVSTYATSDAVSFELYYLATAEGLYSCAYVKDSTVDLAGEAAVSLTNGDIIIFYVGIEGGWTGYLYGDYGHDAYYAFQLAATIVEDGYVLETYVDWGSLAADGISLDTMKLKLGYVVADQALDSSHLHNAFDNPVYTDAAGVYANLTTEPFVSEVDAGFTGANVALGESITINYYAKLPETAENFAMRVTMNDNVTVVEGAATVNDNEYVFAFEGIAPQCMGDNVKAELIVDGEIIDVVEEYSVLKNVKNVMNDSNKQLIYDLLAYGAAAQMYAEYKTDALVNAGYEDLATEISTVTCADRAVTEALDGAKFTAAGVYHANTNKIYAKIETVDDAAVTVTINGEEATLEHYKYGGYIVYTGDINVTEYSDVYTFVITDASGNTQTLTYSVNAWCAVKYNAEKEETAELAKALYAYGQSALAYIAG